MLVEQIRVRGEMTVAGMVAYLADTGFEVVGRQSKVVSDCLRWEVARGRVVRVRRGVYAYGKTPKSTARRIRVFACRCEAWIAAVMRSEAPPGFVMGWLWTV